MCFAQRRGFLGIQRGMNAAEHHVRAARTRLLADLVPLNRVARMNADADDVAGSDGREVHAIQCFIDKNRIAPLVTGSRREDVQPPGRDDRDAERQIAWIDQMYS